MLLLVVPHADREIVALAPSPPAPLARRVQRRQRVVVDYARRDDVVVLRPDPARQIVRERLALPLRDVDLVHGALQKLPHPPGPGLLVEFDHLLQFAQNMRDAQSV